MKNFLIFDLQSVKDFVSLVSCHKSARYGIMDLTERFKKTKQPVTNPLPNNKKKTSYNSMGMLKNIQKPQLFGARPIPNKKPELPRSRQIAGGSG